MCYRSLDNTQMLILIPKFKTLKTTSPDFTSIRRRLDIALNANYLHKYNKYIIIYKKNSNPGPALRKADTAATLIANIESSIGT